MKSFRRLLLVSLPLFAFAMTACKTLTPSQGQESSQEEVSSQEEKQTKTLIKIAKGDGVEMNLTPISPLGWVEEEEDALTIVDGVMTNSSFNHRTGEVFSAMGSPDGGVMDISSRTLDDDPRLVETEPYYYLFAKATLEFLGDTKLYYLDAEHCVKNNEANVNKALRICFYSETASFIYAPFQDAAKCSYMTDLEGHVSQYGDELIDQSSTNKIALPNRSTMVIWFDGNDENMRNDSSFGDFQLTLAFA